MTFKSNWEKTDQLVSRPDNTVAAMLNLAFPDKQLGSYEIISGGCANLNLKINLISDDPSFILRIYLRDKEAAYQEQKLGQLLKQTVPIPQIYFIGNYNGYRFGIAEHLPGITLRDLLLGSEPHDLSAIMFDVGKLLASIQSHHFSAAGIFDKHLNIAEAISQDAYIEFAQQCLKHSTVINCLSVAVITKIGHYLQKYKTLFPDESENHLVHADYDPANILVEKKQNHWEITGILDWEFAFSGSPLTDVANMLRYAHQMPYPFEVSFLHGLQEEFTLPIRWRLRVHLHNLLALLDCLTRSTLDHCPNQCNDICTLIDYIIKEITYMDDWV